MKTKSNPVFKWIILALSLGFFCFSITLISLSIGASQISLKEVFSSFFQTDSMARTIILEIRLPRILLGLAVGSALSLCGLILQGTLRNPLLEPYTLGISGGAALGVSLSIFLKPLVSVVFSNFVSGLCGSFCVLLLVYFLGVKKADISLNGLILTGVMLSFICSSMVMLIMSLSNNADLHKIVFWIMGTLDGTDKTQAFFLVGVSLTGFFISTYYAPHLNAFSLGEDEASSLGINFQRTKTILLVLSSVLTAFCVSISGIIAFVGLAVPHFCRILFGTDYRFLVVASFLTGGAFLVLCDTVARTIISPLELPVGVVTGIIGGITFLYSFSRNKKC